MKWFFVFLVIIMIIVVWGFVENHIFVVHTYKVKDSKIPKSFHNARIMYLADYHNTSYGKDNKRLKKAIKRCHPDYVMIGGDLLSKPDRNFVAAFDLLSYLSQHYPVYFANGNHETKMKQYPKHYHNNYPDFMQMAKTLPVTFLNNKKCSLVRPGEHGEERIYLYGLELGLDYFIRSRQKALTIKSLENYLGKCQEKGYHILLAHSPNFYEIYDEWGADLVLSGHNHGGMARIPFVGGVLSTEAKLFPRYSKGVYKGKNGRMIVSAGLGSHTIKIRYFNPPELLMITLDASDS